MKIKKKFGGWGGVRLDVNEELVGGGGGGVRVDVKAMLGVGGDVGYVRCEPRIEGIVQCAKKVLYNIKKIKKMWGGGRGRGNI